MKTIPLSQGKMALVDDSDYEWLSQWNWNAIENRRTHYATRTEKIDDKRRIFRMHREILGLKHGDGLECDHINGNGLDNRNSNLRLATKSQNQRNSRKRLNNRSGYIGVSWDKLTERWLAQIKADDGRKYLGRFDDVVEAAHAYDAAARELHGEFATVNFQ